VLHFLSALTAKSVISQTGIQSTLQALLLHMYSSAYAVTYNFLSCIVWQLQQISTINFNFLQFPEVAQEHA